MSEALSKISRSDPVSSQASIAAFMHESTHEHKLSPARWILTVGRLILIAFGGFSTYLASALLLMLPVEDLPTSLLLAFYGSFVGVLLGWVLVILLSLPWWIVMPIEDCFPNSRALERISELVGWVRFALIWSGPCLGCALALARFEPELRPLVFAVSLFGSFATAGGFEICRHVSKTLNHPAPDVEFRE